MYATPRPKCQAVLTTLAADDATPAADVDAPPAVAKVTPICANARGSHWCTRVGGKEGKGVKGECPGDVGQVHCSLNRRGK
jgi:hypothetical protein